MAPRPNGGARRGADERRGRQVTLWGGLSGRTRRPAPRPGGESRLAAGIAVLLGCAVIGGATARLAGIPVPGPILGMLALLVLLALARGGDTARPGLDPAVSASAWLLRHLQLLFIPAGVGLLAHLGALREEGLPLLAGLVFSWLLGLIAVGWTMQALAGPRGEAGTR